jgi:hypothetical protein
MTQDDSVFLVLWNRGGRLALYLNKKNSGCHAFFQKKIPVSLRQPEFFLVK